MQGREGCRGETDGWGIAVQASMTLAGREASSGLITRPSGAKKVRTIGEASCSDSSESESSKFPCAGSEGSSVTKSPPVLRMSDPEHGESLCLDSIKGEAASSGTELRTENAIAETASVSLCASGRDAYDSSTSEPISEVERSLLRNASRLMRTLVHCGGEGAECSGFLGTSLLEVIFK